MKSTFFYRLPIFAVLLMLSTWTVKAHAQTSTTVDVDIDLVSPPPTCSVTVLSDLAYGTAQKPTSGNASVTINAVSGSRSASGTTVSGSSSVGQVRLSGSNVASYTVTRTFPNTLTRSGGSLPFSGTWAQSTSQGSGYAGVSGSSYNGTAGGAGSSFTRYFRFGGTTSGIDLSDPNGTYTGSISASATCN